MVSTKAEIQRTAGQSDVSRYAGKANAPSAEVAHIQPDRELLTRPSPAQVVELIETDRSCSPRTRVQAIAGLSGRLLPDEMSPELVRQVFRSLNHLTINAEPAKTVFRDPNYRDAVAGLVEKTISLLREGKQDIKWLSNIACGATRAGIINTPLHSAIAEAMSDKIFEFTPERLLAFLEAFHSPAQVSPNLISPIQTHLDTYLEQWSPRQLTTLLTEYARLRLFDERTGNLVATRLASEATTLESKDLIMSAAALAGLNLPHEEFFKAASVKIEKDLLRIEKGHLARFARSLAIIDDNLALRFIEKLSATPGYGLYSTKDLLCLHQARVAVGAAPADHLPPRLIGVDAYIKSTLRPLNAFEKEVYAVLATLIDVVPDFSIRTPYICHGIPTDFRVDIGTSRYVVECDGDDFHLLKSECGTRKTGRDIIQDKIFNRSGFTVIHLSSSEWNACSDTHGLLVEKFKIQELCPTYEETLSRIS